MQFSLCFTNVTYTPFSPCFEWKIYFLVISLQQFYDLCLKMCVYKQWTDMLTEGAKIITGALKQ
jgi:hypothetical protein